jgi:hypothetical protein
MYLISGSFYAGLGGREGEGKAPGKGLSINGSVGWVQAGDYEGVNKG